MNSISAESVLAVTTSALAMNGPAERRSPNPELRAVRVAVRLAQVLIEAALNEPPSIVFITWSAK